MYWRGEGTGSSSLTKTAAIEYGPQGIRVNAICPGLYPHRDHGRVGADRLIPNAAQGRRSSALGQPHEVAEVGAFLRPDRASFVTGAIIPVDGSGPPS